MRIKEHTLSINEKVIILGVEFDGIEDISNHSARKGPKNGIYVEQFVQRPPCFDSYDYYYEPYYRYFVFGNSPQEVEEKIKLFHEVFMLTNYLIEESDSPNYEKIFSVLPVVYYRDAVTTNNEEMTVYSL